MGGFFGVVSKHDCVMDLFFGTDYHSHLGTRRGGMAVYGENGFQRSIHNIENSPFRTKFERDVEELSGNAGIGSISDNEPQPLLIHSHLGSYAIVTVGKINNEAELIDHAFKNGHIHFMEMSGGRINATELTAAIINQKQSLVEGLLYAQEMIQGSMTILLLTPDGIYASRDRYGRTPLTVGQKDEACCVSFESFAYINLGYHDCYELGPGEIVHVSADGVTQLSAPRKEMKICSFLWVYYGYPTSSYEGINVEEMRYRCGQILADRDLGCHGCSHCPGHETAAGSGSQAPETASSAKQDASSAPTDTIHPDIVAGVPDSGIAHAIGYANESGIPVCASVHQVHPNLAAFLHAAEPEPEKPNREDEADPGRRAHQRQEPAPHRRFHCPRNPAWRNHRVPLSERSQRSPYPPGLPAASLRMQVLKLLPIQLRTGPDHPPHHPRPGRRQRIRRSPRRLRQPGQPELPGDGRRNPKTPKLHNSQIPSVR